MTVRLKVGDKFVNVGVESGELPQAPRKCGFKFRNLSCGKIKSPHYCIPRVESVKWFMSGLVVSRGERAGTPFKLGRWQKEMVERVYGIQVWSEEHQRFVRRYDYVWCLLPRRQGKTEMSAALANLHLCIEPQAQVILGAQNKKEALAQINEHVRLMGIQSPITQQYGVEYRRSEATHYCERNGGIATVISSDGDTSVRGKDVSCALVDEILAIKDAGYLMDVISKCFGSRSQNLIICTTTASPDLASYEREETARMREIKKDPDKSPTTLPILYEPKPGADLWAEDTIRSMNPLIEDGLYSFERVMREMREARGDPQKENNWLRERMNTPRQTIDSYIPLTVWDNIAKLSVQETRDKIRELDMCWAGFDLSMVSDLTSLALLGVDTKHNRFYVATWNWIPDAAVAKLDKGTNGLISQWINSGGISVLPAGKIAPQLIASEIMDILAHYPNLIDIGYDSWQAKECTEMLEMAKYKVEHVRQGGFLSPAIRLLHTWATTDRLEHGNDMVLRYAVDSAELRPIPSNDTVRIEKGERDKTLRRVDPLIAIFNAIERYREHRLQKPAIMPMGMVMSGGDTKAIKGDMTDGTA